MRKWLKSYPIILFLFCAGMAGAATIQSVPLIPRALQGTDKVPVDYAGNTAAYTANLNQIKAFVFGNNTTSPGVYTFNGRLGAVTPQAGDYTAAQVGADPSGTAAAAVTAHNSVYNHLNIPTNQQIGAMTGTSGTPSSTNAFVTNSDSRNSNARTPTAHAATHAANGSDPLTVAASQVTGLATVGTTGSYTDLTSKPTLGTAATKDIPASGNATASQVVYGTDTRLTDARTPLAHNQDATTITTGTMDGDRLPAISTTKKGAVPATGTPSGKYLKDDGTWATVASGTTTKAAAYPSTDDNYGVTAAYLEAALNSGFTISTSDATQKGKPAMWDASTGVLEAATNGALAAVLPTCSGTDKLTSNGTAISCTADQTSTAGAGITSLNGATVSSQTFADGANIHVNTNTGTGAHTIGITGTIPDGNIASSTSWNAKLDPATAASTYHTKAAFNSYSAAQAVKLAGKMNDTSTNPDGTHYVWAYNTTACPAAASTPVGALCTLPGGIYQNTGSAWVVPPDVSSGYSLPTASTSTLGGVKVDGSTITISGGVISSTGGYTLPIAGTSTLGGVKVGSGLAIDGSGVLSAMAGSVNGSGLILAGLTGNQTVKKGFAYIASGNFKATFQNLSSGIATVSSFNNYSGRIVPASGGKFAWANPVTFANNTTAAGYSVKVPPNSSVTLQSLGSGVYYATTTRNLVKTGINETATGGGGGGGSTFYWSMNSTTIDSPTGYTAVAGASATLQSGGPTGNYMDAGGAYHNGTYTIANAASLLNKATTGRVKLSFYVTNNLPKRLFMTTGDQYAFTAYVDTGNVLTFQMGDDSSRATASVTSNAWHTAEFYWSGSTMGMILDGGTAVTHAIAGSRGTGTALILGDASSFYSADKIDEVYFYAN